MGKARKTPGRESLNLLLLSLQLAQHFLQKVLIINLDSINREKT
jgi:hypothetical protein